jgi:hypothetical protein
MRHILSLLMENEAGALSRVSGLFSARAFNIESLIVAPTEDPTVSRMTVVTYARFFKYLIDEHDFYHNLKTGCATSWVISSMIFKKQLKLTPSTSKNYEQG